MTDSLSPDGRQFELWQGEKKETAKKKVSARILPSQITVVRKTDTRFDGLHGV